MTCWPSSECRALKRCCGGGWGGRGGRAAPRTEMGTSLSLPPADEVPAGTAEPPASEPTPDNTALAAAATVAALAAAEAADAATAATAADAAAEAAATSSPPTVLLPEEWCPGGGGGGGSGNCCAPMHCSTGRMGGERRCRRWMHSST